MRDLRDHLGTLAARMRCRALLPLLVASGCCAAAVRAKPLWYRGDDVLATSVQLGQADYHSLSPTETPTLQALHDEVADTVRDARFRDALGQIDAVLGRPAADPISGERLLEIYLGRRTAYRMLRLCYRFAPGGGSETARTGITTGVSPCSDDGSSVAAITLRSVTLERARSTVLEEQACAINTLAHEWTHAVTVPDPRDGHRMVFLDDDHDHQPGAVASYVIGAVAQCAFLANTSDAPDQFQLRACVEQAGTNAFDAASCHAGWAARFR